MIIKLQETLISEFEKLSTMPWPEYVQLCTDEYAEELAQDCERSGEEPTAEQLIQLQEQYA